MNEEQIIKLIQKTIREYNKSNAFTARKMTDTPTDSFAMVNKKYISSIVSSITSSVDNSFATTNTSIVNLTSIAAIASDSYTLTSVSGALQAVVHNLGIVPTRFAFYSTMDGSISESMAKWNLNVDGNKGIELHKFDDNAASQGTYPYNLTGGSPLIHVGQDVSNRMVATVKSSDTSVMTMEWTAVGAPTGTVRFVAEFQ